MILASKNWNWIKTLLFRFDPERVHELSCSLMRFLPSGAWSIHGEGAHEWSSQIFGQLSSPIGLAAGFDKNGLVLAALPRFGFGFAEVGTVTPRPQLGNPRPRLFREPSSLSLRNQMGFNNDGSAIVSMRVEKARPHLPQKFRVGVNVGKNRDTPLELAWRDYRIAAQPFRDLVDYVVVNVSSPNTPGLKDIQKSEALVKIVSELATEIAAWKVKPRLLVKLSPDFDFEINAVLLDRAEENGVNGWVISNTLPANEGGGWSGGRLRTVGASALKKARTKTKLPIIGVGGVLNAGDLKERIEIGADCVQVYTGWVYGGPAWIHELNQALAKTS